MGTLSFKKDHVGSSLVRIWRFNCRGPGSIPVWGTEMLQATRLGQKIKRSCKAFGGPVSFSESSWKEVQNQLDTPVWPALGSAIDPLVVSGENGSFSPEARCPKL